MSFNESSFDKRLQTLQTSQESIQTLSLYCYHHRSHHVLIVQRWLRAYRNSSAKHRLTLFYLANDIIQSSARKNFLAYKQSFLPALKEALVLAKNDQYRPHFERVLKIWGEREVFEPEYHEQLESLIRGGTKSRSKPEKEKEKEKDGQIDKEALLQSFRTKSFMAELERFQRLESSIERAQSLLPNLNFSVGSGLKEHLKDRGQGQQISSELDDTHKKLSEFVLELERHLQQRRDLILLLEQAKIFYETQLQEAGIVEKAYRTFGERIKQVKEQLDVMKLNLPSSPFSGSPGRYDYSYREAGRPSMEIDEVDDVSIVPNQSYIGANLAVDALASGRPRSSGDVADENPGASTPTMDETPPASATGASNNVFQNTLANLMAAADSTNHHPPTSGAAPTQTTFNPVEFLNQWLSTQQAPAAPKPPITTPTSSMPVASAVVPSSLAPPAISYFGAAPPAPPQPSFANAGGGYPPPAPVPSYAPPLAPPGGAPPPGYSGNMGGPPPHPTMMPPSGPPPPFGNPPPFPSYPPPGTPMTPTTPQQQQSPFGMPGGPFSAPPPPVTSMGGGGGFFGSATTRTPTSGASNPGSDIENFPPSGSAAGPLSSSSSQSGAAVLRRSAGGGEEEDNVNMELVECGAYGTGATGTGTTAGHDTSISSANSAESMPSASMMGNFVDGGQEMADYLEDYTSNPADLPEALYRSRPKRDGPPRMGANSQNLTLISPQQQQAEQQEGAGGDDGGGGGMMHHGNEQHSLMMFKGPLMSEEEEEGGLENGGTPLGGHNDMMMMGTPRRIDLVEPRQRFFRHRAPPGPHGGPMGGPRSFRGGGPPRFPTDGLLDGGMFRPRNFFPNNRGRYPPPRGYHGGPRPMPMQQNGQY